MGCQNDRKKYFLNEKTLMIQIQGIFVVMLLTILYSHFELKAQIIRK